MNTTVYILSAKRTPIGSLLGNAAEFSVSDLGAAVIQASLTAAAIDSNSIDEVFMGCVLPAGVGQAPARQAAIKAGLAESIPAVTISKVCGSGMRSVMFGADAIKAGTNQIVIAGGMESMSNAPYLLTKARTGYRLGHGTVYDHTFIDGLEDAYTPGVLMGAFADHCALNHHISREAQDAFALESLNRVKAAQVAHAFDAEMVPLLKNNGFLMMEDEQPGRAKPEKIPLLKPAFGTNGTVTAANASSISDGAAALVLASEAFVIEHHLKPLAKILGHSSFAQKPSEFTTAPIGAIKALLTKLNWTVADVDLFEINEAFAVVTLVTIDTLQLDPLKVNVNGGACALGHPLGASGARIIVTLLHALKHRGLTHGIATLCIGGGEATAIALELC